MKKLACFLFVLITINSFSQSPIEKITGNFTTVKVYDLIHISLVKSTENKVIISGEDADDVEVINKNGILKVRMNLERIFDGTKTFVAVHYTDLKTIDGNEGAKIVANELIEQDFIELRAQEGAQLNIGLRVKQVDIRAVTGGVIETKGLATSQNITINTGGIYEGVAFKTENTTVSISAGGEAAVYASGVVDAKTKAGGDIYIYGNPTTVNKKQLFGGRIERKTQNR